MTMPAPILDRLLAKVVQKDFGCWIWTASTSEGYGRIWTGRPNGRNIMAHRVVYEAFMGPIPKGLTIDHLCRVRRCVNPDHLDIVTNAENVLRGNGAPARNAKRTHCRFGHPYNYVQTTNGQRMCRICNTAYKRFVRAMEREALEKQRKAVEALAGREK